MPKTNAENIAVIRDWLAELDNYPQDFNDRILDKFLHSCYYDLDATKKCILRFCKDRYNMPETFCDRDPLSAKMKDSFSVTHLSAFRAGEKELLLYHLDDPTLEKFNMYDTLKSFAMQADYYFMTSEFLPEVQFFIFDLQSVNLRFVTKLNVFYLRRFITFLLEAMPVRLKQIHLINCPSYIDKLYAIVKPCLPQNIRDIIYFHITLESLHSIVDKKYLPVEMGGDAGSLNEAHLQMVKEIQSPRKIFQNDMMWKADLNKKNKIQKPIHTDFKSLSFD